MTVGIYRIAPLFFLIACSTGDPGTDAPLPGADAPTVDSDAPAIGQPPPGEQAATDSPVAEPAPTPAEWTAGIVDEQREVRGAALLTGVRAAENAGFDRVVLEFEGDELPSYHIEYIDRPVRQCGSGDTVEIAGDGWLSIRVEPANAHTEAGQATIQDRVLRPELDVLRELRMTCDFEAQVEWVLGVSTPNRYRVMELVDPTRLIVDVSH